MSLKNTENRYGTLSIAMHWIMVILIIAVYAAIEGREFFEKGTDIRDAFKMWHFMLGLSVLFLVIIRIYLKLTQKVPVITPTPSKNVMLLTKLAHGALYLMMIILPFAGWMMLSAAGKPIPFFGFELPALIAKNKELAGNIKEVHELVGELGYFLIGLHAVAAIFHHHFIKDDTLTRILPEKKQDN